MDGRGARPQFVMAWMGAGIRPPRAMNPRAETSLTRMIVPPPRRHERGVRNPTVTVVQKLSKTLGTSTGSLLDAPARKSR